MLVKNKYLKKYMDLSCGENNFDHDNHNEDSTDRSIVISRGPTLVRN